MLLIIIFVIYFVVNQLELSIFTSKNTQSFIQKTLHGKENEITVHYNVS